MKVAILDIDSKIPNLALMKIAAYHHAAWDRYDFFKFNYSAYPRKSKPKTIVFDGTGYDIVYASIIFTTNQDCLEVKNCPNVVIGGSGYDLKKELPSEIAELPPRYSLYEKYGIDSGFGFITRGCIRNCYFCFVPKKEGKLKFNCDFDIIADTKFDRIELMDNNILAYPNHKEQFRKIIKSGKQVSFNQGLDIRLIDDENSELLSKMRYKGEYTFAFDDVKSRPVIEERYEVVKRYIQADWKVRFFIYCHPTETTMRDIKERILWCRDNKALPYIMRDFACYTDKHSDFYTDLASWCNQPGIFKNMTFRQFLRKRVNTRKREATSNAIYYVFCN